MPKPIAALETALFSTNDGIVACKAMDKLAALAKKGDMAAKQVLARYVNEGPIGHVRSFVCAKLAEFVKQPDPEFAAVFRKGLSDPGVRHWSILGYLNSVGKDAYKELVRIAEDDQVRLEDRAHAIKCLARHSKQKFDQGLPADPGFWKETDLRLSDLKAWADGGFGQGAGHAEPRRHPSLDKPKSAWEELVSRFDKKLARQRQRRQDLAEPTDWLALAGPEDIERIKAHWNLPSLYLDFLTRFSPISVILESRRFYNSFRLYGAGELIEAQDGYSFDPENQAPIEDWPSNLVVIADHGGDPFVLDLAKSDGEDAPVSTAEHGMGVWEFEPAAKSFRDFLETLAK
jgi:hypothetical protein